MWKWTLSGTESVGHPPYRPGIDRRRFLVTSLAGALAAPLAAEAQQARKIPRIGYLAVAPNPPLEDAFRRGLRDWGYVEGQNLLTEYRFAEGIFDRLPGLAAELVGLRVDVIVAITTEGVNAARHATTTIPIVMPISIDPVGAGLVTTLARPGGNVTGISFPIDDLARKRVQLLKETVAMMSHMAILWNPTFQPSARILGWTQAAAAALGVRSQVLEVRSPDDFEHALDKIDKARATALYVIEDPLTYGQRARIAELAMKSRLASISAFKESAEAAGSSLTARISPMYSGVPPATSTKSSKARSPPTSPWSSPPSSSLSSTSRPPRPSASRSRPRCWRGRIRLLNDGPTGVRDRWWCHSHRAARRKAAGGKDCATWCTSLRRHPTRMPSPRSVMVERSGVRRRAEHPLRASPRGGEARSWTYSR
jgi:putative tryptophan/tyrosine transport system substrate-binding protein